jgi:hypothetical protein
MSNLERLADKIVVALKKYKGKPVIWQKVARSVGLEVASKEFKQAIDYLWAYERIEIQYDKKEGDKVEVKEEKATELKLVTVLTPCGHKALISKEAYDKEKDLENFWRPVP